MRTIPPSAAWLMIFVPACAYFVATRMSRAGFTGVFGHSALGELVATTLTVLPPPLTEGNAGPSSISHCEKLSKILYLSDSCRAIKDSVDKKRQSLGLKHGLYMVEDAGSGLNDITASIWRHDSEMGRGYLLLSESSNNGRIWRWEVGGGPIAIGRTLHLDDAGCRSNLYRKCHPSRIGNSRQSSSKTVGQQQLQESQQELTGSGGIAVDFHKQEHFSEGSLVIAEWGEGRIVRLEENGARTPLILEVPDVMHGCHEQKQHRPKMEKEGDEKGQREEPSLTVRRLERPTSLLYTPFGDLLIIDRYNKSSNHFDKDCAADNTTTTSTSSNNNVAALYQLRHAVHAEPLDSLSTSRKAHAWTSIHNDGEDEKDSNKASAAATDTRKRNSKLNLPEILYHDPNVHQMGDLALAHTWTSLYLSAKMSESIVLFSIPLAEADGDDEQESNEQSLAQVKSRVVFNLTESLQGFGSLMGGTAENPSPGSVAVSRSGHVFWATEEGILILDDVMEEGGHAANNQNNNAAILGIIPTPAKPTSLTIGEDGFLYITTDTSLLRIKVRHGPVKVPTDVVI